MRAIDTNVVVRLIVRDDPEQVRAAEGLIAGGAWVSHLVLAETTWVLVAAYERRPRQVATAVAMLLNHKDLSVQDPDLVASALELFRKRPVLGFSDCLVVQTARKAGHLPFGTFDRDLSKLPGAQRLQ
jgi:predicted nucleic-acid-binding protein